MTPPNTPVSNLSSFLSSTEEIVAEMRAGKMVILVDEEDRENEGDLVLAADHVTPEAINFMAKFGRGLICLTLTQEHCKQLKLPLMVKENGASMGTNFTVSIEAAKGVTTGISAADRSHTIKTAVAKNASAADLVQPGHIFPLMAQPGGVLIRSGHTEAGCDLSSMAGCSPAAVICEIMKDDGTMARLPDLIEFAKTHDLKIGTIVSLIEYRSHHESMVKRVGKKILNTAFGSFAATLYQDTPSKSFHLALTKGQPTPNTQTLVRVHEPASFMDILDPDSGQHSWPLHLALQKIGSSDCGVAVLLNVSGNLLGHEILHKEFQEVKAHAHDDEPKVRKVDFRTYGIGAQILKDQGVGKMRLLAKPTPLSGMAAYQLEVEGYLEIGSQE